MQPPGYRDCFMNGLWLGGPSLCLCFLPFQGTLPSSSCGLQESSPPSASLPRADVSQAAFCRLSLLGHKPEMQLLAPGVDFYSQPHVEAKMHKFLAKPYNSLLSLYIQGKGVGGMSS